MNANVIKGGYYINQVQVLTYQYYIQAKDYKSRNIKNAY